MAGLGGLVLVALVVITCVSVLGRSANTLGNTLWIETNAALIATFFKSLGPIRGDFELVEAGIAFAIFAFLPYCQMIHGHAKVDLLVTNLPEVVQRFLTMLWEILLAVVLVVIAWRLFVGTVDKSENGETTFLLQFPVWWAFSVSAFAAVVAGVVAIYVATIRVLELARNTDLLTPETGAKR